MKGDRALFRDLFAVNGPYSRFMNWLWNIILISVLWLLCSVPIVTAGAASTAAYYAAAKSLRRGVGKTISAFFSSFRSNLAQASCLTILLGVVFAVLILECMWFYADSSVPLVVLYLFYFLAAAVAACAAYVWPCLSRFEKGSFALLKMSAILVFRHLPTTVLLLLLLAAMLAGIYLMPWGILIFPGLAFYLQTFLMERILLRYSPKPVNETEAEKWYYQ